MKAAWISAVMLTAGAGVAQPEPGLVPEGAGSGPAVAIHRAKEEVAPPAFVPSRHGFAFANQFRGSPLPAEVRASPLARRAAAALAGDALPSRFGLCGGMSAASLDLFRAGRRPPDMRSPPEEGSAWYEYLHRRQRDSLGAGGAFALKFIEWMNLPTSGAGDCTAARTAVEVRPLLDRLRAGQPVPIGLVYVRAPGAGDPREPAGPAWSNHQVLAIGLREDATVGASASAPTRTLSIALYDPNCPGDDGVTLRIVLTEGDAPRAGVVQQRAGGRDRAVRGFFVMPYSPADPPGEPPPVQPGPGPKKTEVGGR